MSLFKLDDTLRSVGIKSSFNRDLHKGVVRGNRGILSNFLEAQQLVHIVRMMLEHKREYVAVKLDIKDAHNEVARSSIIERSGEGTLPTTSSLACCYMSC